MTACLPPLDAIKFVELRHPLTLFSVFSKEGWWSTKQTKVCQKTSSDRVRVGLGCLVGLPLCKVLQELLLQLVALIFRCLATIRRST